MPSSALSYEILDPDYNTVGRPMDYAAAIKEAEAVSRRQPGTWSVSETREWYTVAQYENGKLVGSNPLRK